MNFKIILLILAGLYLPFSSYGQLRNCSEVRMNGNTPSLFVNGEYEPLFAYMSYLGQKKFYREMAGSNIRIFNVPAYLGDQGINSSSGIGVFRPSIWVDSMQFDLSSLEKDLNEIISVVEDALIIIRIHLDPPKWWEKKNPDELCRLLDGSSYRVSFFSEKWRHDAGRALEAIVEQLIQSDFSRNLLGIHVAGGMTEEWFYHYKNYFYDNSIARKSAFRKWLRNRYGNSVPDLREAWANPQANFENSVPENISGQFSSEGWRDPVSERSWFDTFDFQAENMADNIDYFCRIVKKVSDGCLLTGAFYGYHFFVFQPQRGHGALTKLLQSPYLDYLSSPNDYNRSVGVDWPPMAAVNSVHLHGKLWLAENDTRTYLTTLLKEKAPDIDPGGEWYTKGVWIGPESQALSHNLLLKNLGRMLTGGYGGWWFDMWGGWFSDSIMLSIIETGVHASYQMAKEGLKSEIAIFVDERLSFYDISFGRQTAKIIQNKYALGSSGAPYDLYLRTDMDLVRDHNYKVVWLLGIPQLSKKELNIIQEWTSNSIDVIHTNLYTTFKHEQDNSTKVDLKQIVFSASEIAQLWREADVHLYTEPGIVLYAGNNWVTIHSATGGMKTIHWPGNYEVVDVINGTPLPIVNYKSRLRIDPGETFLFEINR